MTSQRSVLTATQRLEQAEVLVAHNEKQIDRQRLFVVHMEQAAAQARAVLADFQVNQATHIADRDRLLRQLLRD